ncbi:MAG: hypothetical protein IFK94_16210, partial [Acidobacteria bacterium]|nr:hypothetical protein [Candidatus Polarisedimenticola svalbardensis]
DQYDRDLYIQTFFAGLGGTDGSDDWYGFLPYSIDDQFKLHGRYTIEKWNDVYVTGFFNWASGYHYNRRGFQNLYGDYLTFSNNPWFDGAVTPVDGQDFTEEDGLARGIISGSSFWSLDLTIGKVFSLGKGMDLELRGAFFNVLNDQTPLTRQDKAVASFDTPLARQFPRSGTVFVRLSF